MLRNKSPFPVGFFMLRGLLNSICCVGRTEPPRLIAAVLITLLPAAAAAGPTVAPQQIVEALAARAKNLTAFKAVMGVRTEYDKGKSRQDVRGFLLYRRPFDFRFQGLAPGGNPLFEMVIKSHSFELYVPSERKILKGNKNCFGRAFPDVAELESLIPLALLQWRQAQKVKVISESSEGTVLTLDYSGAHWRITLQPKTLLLKRIERVTPKEVDLIADFGGFSTGEYGWMPRQFDVQSLLGGWKTHVKIDRFDVNPFLVEKNFELEPAFSTKVEKCN